ncbi:tyrosine-type recombinase/integrase [Mesorhizobium sp. IMUNJ 23232]|uniref:tyrosine-type recombinase/integrase n=1 Tax=Mesorhizobium sp. IMUNJ 23232 TaxID=3376064 RepID=UPI00379BB520
MPRVVVESPISTRAARARLEPRAKPYLHGLDAGVHLGYIRGKRSGRWVVRWGNNGSDYQVASLGPADDVIAVGTLDYEAAKRAAREHVAQARKDAEAKAAGPVITTEMAIKDYVAERDARDIKRKGRQVRSDASRRLHRYILGQPKRGRSAAIPPHPIAAIALNDLKESDLEAWRDGLPATLKITSKKRMLNDVKAALNSKYKANKATLSEGLPGIILSGLRLPDAVDMDEDEEASIAREGQILADSDIIRLLAIGRTVDAVLGMEGDLFRLLVVMNATGARFSQIARMRVKDCQVAVSRLMVPVSRKGSKKPKSSSHIGFPVGRDVMDELVAVVRKRRPDEFLLERWRKVQRKGSIEWFRDTRGPWQESSEVNRAWAIIVERAGLPGVVQYCFRHTSIVRFLRKNYPTRVVAAYHDTSTEMIEKYYTAHIADAFEDKIREGLVPLVPAEAGAQVIKMRQASVS